MLISWSQAAWRTWTWLPSHCRRLVTATAWALLGRGEIVDTMVSDALWDACGFNKHMGMTAENVCCETYQKYGQPITRCRRALNSQPKADSAIMTASRSLSL